MAKKEKEWKQIITQGDKVKEKKIKVKQKPIKKPPEKPKDKLDLILEETEGIKKNLKRCEEKIDKLKKEKQ